MMAMKLARTTIINEGTQPVLIRGGQSAGDYCLFNRLLPGKKYTLECFPNSDGDHDFTFVVGDPMRDGPVHEFLFSSDDLAGAEEIIMHETHWRVGKERGTSEIFEYVPDFEAFKSIMKRDASSRMKIIGSFLMKLEKLSGQVEVCPALCENLVQICSMGAKKIIDLYFAMSKNDNYMWGLYILKRLRHLVSSLDRLLSTFESIEDILEACGNEWNKMGLIMSTTPRIIPEKVTTEFDLLIKELNWNFGTIHYVLDLTEDAIFSWDENKCEFVHNKVTFESEMDLRTLVGVDCVHFFSKSKERIILSKILFGLVWILLASNMIIGASSIPREIMKNGSSSIIKIFMIPILALLYLYVTIYWICLVYPKKSSLEIATKVLIRWLSSILGAFSYAILNEIIFYFDFSLLQSKGRLVHIMKGICEFMRYFELSLRLDDIVPSKEMLIIMALCYVFIVRQEDIVRDFLEKCARRWIPEYGDRRYFEEVIVHRLQAAIEFHEPHRVPYHFRINYEHLKFDPHKKIAGDKSKAIYKGSWRGQGVVIGMRNSLERDVIAQASEALQIQTEILNTATLMLKLQHPNVVDFFGYGFIDTTSHNETLAGGYIVMELMDGDLRDEINGLVLRQPGRPFPDDVALHILLQIVEAMIHVHECGVLYRDLKAKNCVVKRKTSRKSNSPTQVSKFYTVKLIDFDISKMLDWDDYISQHTMRQGTTRWMAPEVWGLGEYVKGLRGQKTIYTQSVDVYSFGMTCYEIITGEIPFYNCKKNSELELVLQKKERPVLPPGLSCPKPLEELMSRCWAQEPSARPTFKEIKKALWTFRYELELQ